MTDEAVIREALIRVYDEECRMAEQEAELSGPHAFSDRFFDRMKKISGMARRQYVTVMHRRVRLALVVAALIAVMVAATVTTIAIVRPQIFYTVRKGLKSWDYTFRQEDPNKLAGEFVIKKPVVPEGYETVQDDETDTLCMTTYSNDEDRIVYIQEKFNETSSTSITDTATKESVKLKNGLDAELYLDKSDEAASYLLFWNDGVSIYTLIWDNCSKEEILDLADTIK